MKKLAGILILFLAAAFSMAAESAVSFTETKHDFGNINEKDGPVTYVFHFTNDGDTPLIIVNVTTQCGCTTPKYSMEPVAPGEDGTVSVTFNPRGYAGEFSKLVKVKTNDPKNKTVKLRIMGAVIPKK